MWNKSSNLLASHHTAVFSGRLRKMLFVLLLLQDFFFYFFLFLMCILLLTSPALQNLIVHCKVLCNALHRSDYIWVITTIILCISYTSVQSSHSFLNIKCPLGEKSRLIKIILSSREYRPFYKRKLSRTGNYK